MNNYVDQYGRYHHKPVTAADPVPSNNGWIYTAYAVKVGLEVDIYKLKYCVELSDQGDGVIWRTPGKELPPMSRDEVLGMTELGVLPKHIMDTWSFSPYPIPKFNLVMLVKQAWELRPDLVRRTDVPFNVKRLSEHRYEWKSKHRNYLWQNKLDQLYRFAFAVPLVDRHYILQKHGKFNIFYWAIAKIDSMVGGESGIRFLKYGKSKKAMQQEFPEDHPIRNI